MAVVTHQIPGEWANREGSPFTFFTEGVPEAINVARLLDAIHIDLAPVVLGHGIRLFDHLDHLDHLTRPVGLLITEASGNPHVTHITYQVIK